MTQQIQIKQLFPDSKISCTILTIGSINIMLDCGGQPPYDNVKHKYMQIKDSISCIIITGSSPNQCGALPFIRHMGFTKHVYYPEEIKDFIYLTFQCLLNDLATDFQQFRPADNEDNYLSQDLIDRCFSANEYVTFLKQNILQTNLPQLSNISILTVLSGYESVAVYIKHDFFQEHVFYANDLIQMDKLHSNDFIQQNQELLENSKLFSTNLNQLKYAYFQEFIPIQTQNYSSQLQNNIIEYSQQNMLTILTNISQKKDKIIIPVESYYQLIQIYLLISQQLNQLQMKSVIYTQSNPTKSYNDKVQLLLQKYNVSNQLILYNKQQQKDFNVIFVIGTEFCGGSSHQLLTNTNFLKQNTNMLLCFTYKQINCKQQIYNLVHQVMKNTKQNQHNKELTLHSTLITLKQIEGEKDEVNQKQKLRDNEITLYDYAEQIIKQSGAQTNQNIYNINTNNENYQVVNKQQIFNEIDIDAFIYQLQTYDKSQTGYQRPPIISTKKIIVLEPQLKLQLLEYLCKYFLNNAMQFKNTGISDNSIVQTSGILQQNSHQNDYYINNYEYALNTTNPLEYLQLNQKFDYSRDAGGKEFGYQIAYRSILKQQIQENQTIEMQILSFVCQMILAKYKITQIIPLKFEFHEIQSKSLEMLAKEVLQIDKQNTNQKEIYQIQSQQQKTNLQVQQISFQSLFGKNKQIQQLKRKPIIYTVEEQHHEEQVEEQIKEQAYITYQQEDYKLQCQVCICQINNLYLTKQQFIQQFTKNQNNILTQNWQHANVEDSSNQNILQTKPQKSQIQINLTNSKSNILINTHGQEFQDRMFGNSFQQVDQNNQTEVVFEIQQKHQFILEKVHKIISITDQQLKQHYHQFGVNEQDKKLVNGDVEILFDVNEKMKKEITELRVTGRLGDDFEKAAQL